MGGGSDSASEAEVVALLGVQDVTPRRSGRSLVVKKGPVSPPPPQHDGGKGRKRGGGKKKKKGQFGGRKKAEASAAAADSEGSGSSDGLGPGTFALCLATAELKKRLCVERR
jgi:hypothetical protein